MQSCDLRQAQERERERLLELADEARVKQDIVDLAARERQGAGVVDVKRGAGEPICSFLLFQLPLLCFNWCACCSTVRRTLEAGDARGKNDAHGNLQHRRGCALHPPVKPLFVCFLFACLLLSCTHDRVARVPSLGRDTAL